MPRRPTAQSLESLHVTLQKLEQSSNPGQEDGSISELKQVVLNRIIDLELSKTLVTEDDDSEEGRETADLAALPPLAESLPAEDIPRDPLLEKLD